MPVDDPCGACPREANCQQVGFCIENLDQKDDDFAVKVKAIEAHTWPAFECSICGAPERNRWVPDVMAKLTLHQRCKTCQYWHDQKRYDDKAANGRIGIVYECERNGRSHGVFRQTSIVEESIYDADGTLIRMATYRPNRHVELKIRRLSTGTIYLTDKLWHQGSIPVRFYDMFPVNFEILPRYTEEEKAARIAEFGSVTP